MGMSTDALALCFLLSLFCHLIVTGLAGRGGCSQAVRGCVPTYLPCMLRTAVLIRGSLQDGALLTAAVWGVLVGLHLPARGSRQTPQPVGPRH